MTGTFEDKFDHDPDAVYEEEEDLDLGPDDEFADSHKVKPKVSQPVKKQKMPSPGGGCLFGLFKVFLSLGIIGFCYFYIFQPEKFTTLQNKINELIASVEHDSQAPVLSIGKSEVPSVAAPSFEQPERPVPQIVLRGSGILPDYSTVAKQKNALNFHLIEADQIRFETLDTYHDLLQNLIFDWTGESDPAKIQQMTGMPYQQFVNRISASLLSQTVLRQAGLTPANNRRMILQDPVQAMAAVYPRLKEAMATKKTVRDQLKTIEPVSTFLIYICNDSSECFASWDLLIDMLGAKKYAQLLEKSPEVIYQH